jgi:hypothetical protein
MTNAQARKRAVHFFIAAAVSGLLAIVPLQSLWSWQSLVGADSLPEVPNSALLDFSLVFAIGYTLILAASSSAGIKSAIAEIDTNKARTFGGIMKASAVLFCCSVGIPLLLLVSLFAGSQQVFDLLGMGSSSPVSSPFLILTLIALCGVGVLVTHLLAFGMSLSWIPKGGASSVAEPTGNDSASGFNA